MNQDKIVQFIEQELVQAEEAQTDAEFEKHMYAIHTLTSLFSTGVSAMTPLNSNQSNMPVSHLKTHASNESTQSRKKTNDVSVAEIKAMGGKVPASMKGKHDSSSNIMTTDDNIGKGESIFDF
ncbi:DUF5327 family protein [Staphylococcus saccharolyticus]|uniref:DUF5327 family protein n=1 Tax=Staphylococcus saccharolyticus TaxID=33028 RepID=UPI0032E0019D